MLQGSSYTHQIKYQIKMQINNRKFQKQYDCPSEIFRSLIKLLTFNYGRQIMKNQLVHIMRNVE